MIYFLDFDRTVFDTDTFKDYLSIRERDPRIVEEPEADVARMLNERTHSGALTFSPGELTRFLYPEVSTFFIRTGNAAIIITFGNIALQQAKLESALQGIVHPEVLYTGDVLKGQYLKAWPRYDGQEATFIDDRVMELEAMAQEYPNMHLFEMRRDGKQGDGRWPVIRSLDELP